MPRHPKDYHDYVFKNGNLLGKFEEMYRHSRETPWHQDKTSYYVFSEIDIAILKQHEYRSICDIGCGLGFFTSRLRKELKAPDNKVPRVTGIDISPTAIKKASRKFPGIRFLSGDPVKRNIPADEKFDLVVVKEIFWYVFNNLSYFMRNTVAKINKGGFLYVSQSFPSSKTWVGKEAIDSPQSLQEILASYVTPIHSCIEINRNFEGSPHLHFLGKAK